MLPERSRQCEQSWQYAVLSRYVSETFWLTPAPCQGSSLPCVAKTRCAPTNGRLPPNRASKATVSGNADALYAWNAAWHCDSKYEALTQPDRTEGASSSCATFQYASSLQHCQTHVVVSDLTLAGSARHLVE